MMGSRLIPVVLMVLLLALQNQLWFGRGSLSHVSELEERIQQQKDANAAALHVNEQLNAEVNDLKEGLNMVEERARRELGMVKPNEVYVQIAK